MARDKTRARANRFKAKLRAKRIRQRKRAGSAG